MSFQESPGSFQESPGSFQESPGSFQESPGSFQESPGSSPQTKSVKSARLSCGGDIIFSNVHATRVAVVITPQNQMGFPKGSPKPGETTIKQIANREVKEEVGLVATDLMFANMVEPLVELNDKGNVSHRLKPRATSPAVDVSVKYYVAYTKEEEMKLVCEDVEELAEVKWMDVADVLKDNRLLERRKELLRQAVKLMSNGVFHEEAHDVILAVEKQASRPKQKQIHKNVTQPSTKKVRPPMSPQVHLSKALTYFLRHGIVDLKIKMDSEGWVAVRDLLVFDNMKKVTIDQIKEVVDTSDKKSLR